jgi:aryl carrier-like protein
MLTVFTAPMRFPRRAVAGVRCRIAVGVPMFVFLFPFVQLFGQESGPPAFNLVRTPTSPAFVLLGIAPTAVERPNTPSALGLSILNTTNSFSSLPQNYAVEFSPYWILPHPRLTWRQDTVRTIVESLMRTGTLSIATAQLGSDVAPVTGFSVGLRTALISGAMTRPAIISLVVAESLLATQASSINRRLNEVLRSLRLDELRERELLLAGEDSVRIFEVIERYATREDSIRAALMSSPTVGSFSTSADEQLEEALEGAGDREGFALEAAFGLMWQYPGMVVDSARFSRFGAWLTPSYQARNISIIGVVRFLSDEVRSSMDLVDLGARLLYTHDLFAVSGEYVHRLFTGGRTLGSQQRIAGIAEYRVLEDVWLQVAVGKDYDPSATGSLIARLGLSFQFGRQRYQPGAP